MTAHFPAARPRRDADGRGEPSGRVLPFGPVHREDGTALAGLSIVREAVGICWQGRRLNLSASEARIVAYVAVAGRASWRELNLVLGREACSVSTLRVFLYRLRRKLLAAGAPDLMETVRGWGVVLKPQPGGAFQGC